MSLKQQGNSGLGLQSCGLRDLDYVIPRVPLRPTALPSDVRRQMGFSDRRGGKPGKRLEPPVGEEDQIHTNQGKGKVSRATR